MNPQYLTTTVTLPGGGQIKITVPMGFDADQFETAVGLLVQLRVAADQRREAEESKILKIDRPKLLVP